MSTALGETTVQVQPGAEKPVEYLLKTGRFQEALWILKEYLVRFKPEMGIYGNMAVCYNMIGDPVNAAAMAKKALEFEPDNTTLLHAYGKSCMGAGEYPEAIKALRKLVKVAPNWSEGYAILGMALRCYRRFDEAYDVYESYARNTGAHDVHIDSSIVFTKEMDERSTFEERMAIRKTWYDRHRAPWRFTAWANNRDPNRPLTIGYVSGDFRVHSAAYAFRPLILDRDRENFKVVCLSIDGGLDGLGTMLKEASDTWLQLPQEGDESLSWAMRNHGIDIMVDLSGHTPGNRLRLFTTKPAPIAVSMIGMIGSTGVPDIDYTMVDDGYVPMEEGQHYADKPWYLPSAIHFKVHDYAPPVAASPCVDNGYVTFGCMHHFSKVTDVALKTWGDILRAAPTAKILVKDDVVTSEDGEKRVLSLIDVDPERIIRAHSNGHQEHLGDHAKIDVALDAWPQGGGVTTLEAISMGVPLVSLRGERPYQRGCVAIAKHLPQDVFLTSSVEAYIQKAVDLTKNPHTLVSQRFHRRERLQKSVLGDAGQWVRSVEDAYREMWKAYCSRDPS